MEILVKRVKKGPTTTLSDLSINGEFLCNTCEDVDRGLTSTMPLSEIKEKKVHGKTAIPTGRYQLILSFSQRFQKYLPELLNVPGFAGIRIHSGNTAADSEGCLLPGTSNGIDRVNDSRTAMTYLMKKLQAVEKKEKIWLTIE